MSVWSVVGSLDVPRAFSKPGREGRFSEGKYFDPPIVSTLGFWKVILLVYLTRVSAIPL